MPCCWASAWSNRARESTERDKAAGDGARATNPGTAAAAGSGSLLREDRGGSSPIRRRRLLLVVFVGANFVAATFLAWLPSYIFERFNLGLSSFVADLDVLAARQSAGRGCWAAWRPTGRRGGRRGGRIRVQSAGPDPGRAVRVPDRMVDVGARS